jgi:hypothetical protein
MRGRHMLAVLGLVVVCGSTVASADALPNGTWHSAQTGADLPVVKVLVNGQAVESDVPAVVLDGRTLLPVRAVAQALGVSVSWDQGTYTATVTTAPNAVVVPIQKGAKPGDGENTLFIPCAFGQIPGFGAFSTRVPMRSRRCLRRWRRPRTCSRTAA